MVEGERDATCDLVYFCHSPAERWIGGAGGERSSSEIVVVTLHDFMHGYVSRPLPLRALILALSLDKGVGEIYLARDLCTLTFIVLVRMVGAGSRCLA